MKNIIPCYNSTQQTLADKQDEERTNRLCFRYFINDLHELSFKTALKAAEQSIREGSDPKRAILNNFELYQFIQLLRRELSEPGTDLGLEPEWEETEYTELTIDDFVMALSPEAASILLEEII